MLSISEVTLQGERLESCSFIESCANASNGGCHGIKIQSDNPEHLRLARVLGLNPNVSGGGIDPRKGHVTEVELCASATANPVVVDGVRQAFSEAFVSDAAELAGHREAHAVLKGQVDIDDVETDHGFAMLDKMTSGATPRYVDHNVLAADQGALEIIPVYNLEVNS